MTRKTRLPSDIAARDRALTLLLALVWLGCLGAGMANTLSRLSVPTWGNPLGEAQSVEIRDGIRVGQSFTAPQQGLSGIQVSVYAQPSTARREATLRLSQAGLPAPVGARTLALAPEAAVSRLRLDVTPIPDSLGKSFHLSIESDCAPGEGFSVGYSPGSALEEAGAELNGEPIEGDLQFLTYYSASIRQKVDMLLAALAKGPLHDRGLAPWLGAGALSAGSLCLFVWRIAHATKAKEDEAT